ncbi:hypothetical protein ACSZNT_17535 [Aeromonas veronii]|uniref:hypothetical protein n=1 Tax=Aeromonas TaxID=642 RepID=UPI00084A9BC7|nr:MULTISPECIES: hypothetical protein [Aeromonas]MCF5728836.1 hypothetical protein [Aeromonas veronii]NJI36280.1 hypothetical protein [Aeromonas veronii]OEC46509.1 hypothetical protein A9G06_01015 [Aeromonas sp. DNP9]
MSLFALNMIALSMIALTCIVAPFNADAAELPPQPTAASMIGHLEPVQPTLVERPDQPEIVLDMVALNESIVSEALATIKDAKQ